MTVRPKTATAVKGATVKSATAAAKKKKKVSAKQRAAGLKWAAAGRAAQAKAKKAAKAGVAVKKKAALPAASALYRPVLSIWLPGCNDDLPVCASVAIANHLLASAGITAADEDILALHARAGGDDGATLENALGAAMEYGLAGVLLEWAGLAGRVCPGTVCGISTRRGYHAVLAHPYGMISWGMVLPWAGEIEEAWALDWAPPR